MNLSALRSGNFRTYFFGNAFALTAIWMQRVTVGWIAWDMTGAASFVGLVGMLQFAPIVVLGPLFGVWVDRINVKPAALMTQTGNLLVTLGLFATVWFEVMSPMVLLFLVIAAGTIAAAHNPVRLSMAPRLVERELVASVVNLTSINFNMARLIGPAIGGAAIAALGVSQALLIQAVCFLPFLLAITWLEVRPRAGDGKENPGFLTALIEGVRHVRSEPLVRDAMLATGAMTLVARGVLEILPILADGVFDKGATGLGMLTSAAGLGAVTGGFAKALLPPQRSGRLPLSGLLAAWGAVALVPVLGVAPSWLLALAAVAAIGFCTTVTAVSMQTAIQIDLPDDLRGRVMSLWIVVAVGGAALGAGLLGVLADLIGFSLTLGLSGSVVAVVLGVFAVRVWLRS